MDLAERMVQGSGVRKRWPLALAAATVLLVAALLVGYFHLRTRSASTLSEQDTLVLADFDNTTGETVFDATLKQALRVQLEQSPFLNVLSDQKIGQTLGFMGRPRDTRLTASVMREVCLRTGSKVFVGGSISSLGNHYVVLLQAVNCQRGEAVSNEEAEAESREKVLRALGEAATRLRSRLGESLTSIKEYDTPVEEATTASLDALRAYSLGAAVQVSESGDRAVPFLKRAIELDPNFAMAYAQLGTAYFNSNQPTLATAALAKAYDLRGRVSQQEKLYIESHYYDLVTGQADKAVEVYRLWLQTYPQDKVPYVNLGSIYGNLGQYDLAVEKGLEALRHGMYLGAVYAGLTNAYINLNQFDRAEQILREADRRKVETSTFPALRYQLAFAQGNEQEMERQLAAAEGQPGIGSFLLALQADSEAHQGHLVKARQFTRRAIELAGHDGDEETALTYAAVGALRESECGNRALATRQVTATLAHSHGEQVQILGALTFARVGEPEKALALIRDLNRRFPLDTLLNEYWAPTIMAVIELYRNRPSEAIESLEKTRRYELASPQVSTNVLPYPIFLRGEAYLAAGLPDKAQVEFQKIFDHPGLAGNYLLGPLAHLDMGRAYAMEAGIPVMPIPGKPGASQYVRRSLDQPDTLAKSRSAYQDFFSLWRDADVGVPILTRAQQEYRKLR